MLGNGAGIDTTGPKLQDHRTPQVAARSSRPSGTGPGILSVHRGAEAIRLSKPSFDALTVISPHKLCEDWEPGTGHQVIR